MPVDPYKTSLDKETAYWMAQISKQVYEKISDQDSSPNVKTICENLKEEDDKFINVFGFNRNRAQAILVEHNDYLCMAFRGTDELSNWLDNINAFRVKELFGEFHRGFWNSVKDVWDEINGKYQELNNSQRRPLFLTGHSLGGAMATIAASRLIHMDDPFISVYTFGQPRTMTRSTAQIFNIESKGRFFRFNNNNDLVTRAPSRLMGYSHVGTYLHISRKGQISQELGYWFNFLDSVGGALESLRESGIDGIEDHDMNKYIEAVKNWEMV